MSASNQSQLIVEFVVVDVRSVENSLLGGQSRAVVYPISHEHEHATQVFDHTTWCDGDTNNKAVSITAFLRV
jgi:hypothetical protein